MKKIVTKIAMISVFTAGVSFAQAQSSGTNSEAEVVATGTSVTLPSTQALLDHQFTIDITAATGSVGNAGVVHLGTSFWVAKWNSDTVWVLDNTGAMQSFFHVPLGPGGGIRALTTDGTNVYAAQNGNAIVVIDIATQTVTGTIPVSVGFSLRSLTYDPTSNGGAGGFWVSNFNTNIVQISMTGTVLSTILAATHGLTGMYGTAVDNISSLTQKYLWVYDQPANPGAVIWQLEAVSGLMTGATVDVNSTLGYQALAGGICIAQGLEPQPSLIGLAQQTPNSLDGFELTLAVGISEASENHVEIFPIPANDYIYFKVGEMKAATVEVLVFDARGSQVASISSTERSITVNTSEFTPGVYTATINNGGSLITKKFIVK